MSSPMFEHPTVHGAISLALGRRPTRSPERYRKDTAVFTRATCNEIEANIRIADNKIFEIERHIREVQREIDRLARDVERIEARLSNTDIAQSLLSALSAAAQAARNRNPIAAIRALLDAADILREIGERREAARLESDVIEMNSALANLNRDLATTRNERERALRALAAHNCGT